jgi:hypothetical protein
MTHSFQPWELDFIYLTCPTESISSISKFLKTTYSKVNHYTTKLSFIKITDSIKIGDIILGLTILKTTYKRRLNKSSYICRCTCGKEIIKSIYDLFYYINLKCKCKDKPKINKQDIIEMYNDFYTLRAIARKYKRSEGLIQRLLIKSNITIRTKDLYLKLNKPMNYSGYEEITGVFWSTLKGSAKRRNIIFNINKKYVWNIFLKQNKKCALTGIDLFFDVANKKFSGNASLDRIDSSKGYIEGNVQWVTKTINIIKRDLHNTDFLLLCQQIIDYQKEK